MKHPVKFNHYLRIKTAFILLAIAFVSGVYLPKVEASYNAHFTAKPERLALAIQNLQQTTRRWIQIDLTRQRLIAWEGNIPMYAVVISTGKASTPTPTGKFSIQTRHRYARMQGADYDISDVPYTMYYSGNYAIHGAYWHHRFGTPVSHGCVNVAVNHARWLFNWAKVGTPVVVHK